MKIPVDADSEIIFTCNICGVSNRNRVGKFHREVPDCGGCGSTPRFRGIIHALSIGLFGTPVPLPEFPVRKDIRGVGMSEWEGYAGTLAERFTFQNTFFHMAPRLDIMDEDWRSYTDLDFVICTEVFEHVLQPLSAGLANLRRMLKPGGVLIFSVPFTDAPRSQEHYPGMQHFATCQIGDTWIVVAEQADGAYQVYDQDVVFHGGPGTVLEMRLFGQDDLRQLLEAAGFEVKFHDQPDLGIGYVWSDVEERAGAGLSLGYLVEARPRAPPPATAPSTAWGVSVPLGTFEPPVRQVEHTPEERRLIDAFGDLYYRKWEDGQGLSTIHLGWLGYETFKCPLDLWMYQELMVRERLDYVIETGTRFGGSALFMATVFDLIGSGMVISVDSDYTVAARRPLHRRIVYLCGSTTDEAIVEQVAGLVPSGKRVMVVLDSDHSCDHVLAEMRLYERFLLPGGRMIVEDTNINGHPTYQEFGPGPWEAVTAFLAERDDFEVDADCERFLLTMNPRGYLRRRTPTAR